MSLVDAAGAPIHKVLIAVPCGDLCHSTFAQDLAQLTGYTQHVRPEMDVRLTFVRGTYLPRARASLVKAALDYQATHIFWLDADMRFPKDALARLLLHDVPIVGANYPTRQPPILPTARTATDFVWEGDDLVPVKQLGFGCLLTRTEVFAQMGKPWFAVGYSPQADEYAGEDVFFCEQAHKAGFTAMIDPRLSEEIQHSGTFAFQMGHARMTRQAAEERERNESGQLHEPQSGNR